MTLITFYNILYIHNFGIPFQSGKRKDANIIFNTALGTIFSVPKYAAALRNVASSKNIAVNYLHSLCEVKPDVKEAIFDVWDNDGKLLDKKMFKVNM